MDTTLFKEKYFVIFVTHHLYYIPQFLPIAKELKRRNRPFLFLLLGMDSTEQNKIAEDFCQQNHFRCHFYKTGDPIFNCKFMINGANCFPNIALNYKYSALVVHGIGTKAGYYTEEQNKHDIRFVEGQHRIAKIKELFPLNKSKLYNVGFAKLDEAFVITENDKLKMIKSFGLDSDKKTILYAPTFYPSSIDKMPKDFPAYFSEYNLIIKPHFFSFLIKTYRHHLKIFKKWNTYSNVYFADVTQFNLVPFMTIADIMISDESSAIFEFAALNKPVICNRNVKFRLSYRLLKSKIKKRMDAQMDPFRDVATTVYKFNELIPAVKQELENPSLKEDARKKITEEIVGAVDGKVSERIADIMDSLD
jgi:CDP-glycerol glycerophosphotransferase (TagB/SpsB family)